MKSFRALIVGLAGAVAIFLGGVRTTARADDARTKADVTVTDAGDGKAVHLKTNQVLAIRLESNPSTGYSWYAVGGRDNDGKAWGNEEFGVLAPSGGREYVAKPAPDGVVGSGGADIFRYFSRQPGTTTLRFIYMRPWEKGAIGKRASFKVIVE